jgi:hypothetical protein
MEGHRPVAAERERAPGAGEAREGLAAEAPAALQRGAGVRREAGLQREDGTGAATQGSWPPLKPGMRVTRLPAAPTAVTVSTPASSTP